MKLPERLEEMEANIAYFRDDERPLFVLDDMAVAYSSADISLEQEAH